MERNYYSLYLQTAKLLNEAVEPKTVTFESGSEVHWDYSEDCLQSCMNSVNCSSIEIDFEED